MKTEAAGAVFVGKFPKLNTHTKVFERVADHRRQLFESVFYST
jgi:hypothetical protein